LNGRSFRLFWLPVAFAIVASFFPDRIHYLWSLFAAVLLFLAAKRLGRLVVQRWLQEDCFYFPFGLGIFLLVAFGFFSFTTGKGATYGLWIATLILAPFEIPVLTKRLSLQYLWASPFVLLGFWSCLTPATFYDALVYHLGLPHQYLLQGKMQIIPHHLYSTFPPFDQILNLLFSAVNADAGIKIFSIVLLFGIIYTATGYIKSFEKDFRMEHLVVPFLAIPTFWILVHLVTADLLTAFFFSSGIFLLLLYRDRLSAITFAAALIAFSCWTKWNVLLYLPFVIILFGTNIRKLVPFTIIVFVLITPLLIRNYLSAGDPLYPILSVKLSNPNWSTEQAKALAMDSFPTRARTFKSFLLAPLELMTKPDRFGSASRIGFVPLFLILVSPFAARREFRSLILYIVVCFFAWLFVFPNFRQFIPVFVLIAPLLYSCWNWLAKKSALVFAVVSIVWGAAGIYYLLPIYQDLFPLISIKQNRDQYLTENLQYYPIARDLKYGKAILIGETRSAYFQVPVIASTAYDQHPFEEILKKSGNAQSFYLALKGQGITYVVYDSMQFQRLSKKYGLWKISHDEQQILQEFEKQFIISKLRVNGIYLLQLK
jgi:hypothetical protein